MKTPKRPNFHQEISLRRGPKHGPEQPKAIGLECNPITTCFFHSMASIDHISLVYTLNCDLFEALKVAPILTQSWHHCVAMHFAQPCFNQPYPLSIHNCYPFKAFDS